MKKRRLLSIVLSLCMVLALMPQMVFADTISGTTEDGFSYTISDAGEVTITGYTGSGGAVEIPSTIDNTPVKSIGQKAFMGCKSLTSIVISGSVTSIGANAFYDCTSLTSVVIPDSVTSIGDTAFDNCTSLTSIVIPDSVTSIGVDAFRNCTSLKNINIPNGVTTITYAAFENCTNLSSITISDSVTLIEAYAFRNCTSLASVTIPDGVTHIGSYAFSNCTNLSSITIPGSVTSIEYSAFRNCTSLESINIPNGVVAIGRSVFSGCTSLASVTIPDSVEYISGLAFDNCTSLASVTIPNGVRAIRESAFENCTSLKSVIVPSNVSLIGYACFNNCTSLESIFLPDNNNLNIEGDAENETIPDTTTKVKYSLDTNKGEAKITGITLGTGKTSVAIPEKICGYSVNSISADWTGITSIFLPQDFDETNANIPNTVTKIKYSLDADKGEVTITKITLRTGETSVAIPEKILGYPVIAVAASEQSKVGAHTCKGGTATCTAKALCSICGKEYGEKKPDNHSGKLAWETTETQHKQYWDCCNAVVVNYVDHTWNSGVCSDCDYVCKHTGGIATCTKQAVCSYCGKVYGGVDRLNHNLDNIQAKEATVAETGNIEYWLCRDCEKCFAEENGTDEISLEETVIQKLPPEIIKGEGQSITAGEKKALSFTSNAAFEDFKSVTLDGSELSEEYYEKAEGSIIITLDADYVATLPAGEHTIGIVSESGTAETTFTVVEKAAPGTSDDSDKDSKSDEDSVKTGDNTNLAIWLALMLLSGAGITGVTAYTRRKRTNE